MDYLKALMSSLRGLLVASVAGSMGSADAQPFDRQETVWQDAVSQGTVAAFQRYLEEFPVGRHAAEAFRSIVEGSIGAGIGATSGPAESGPLTRGLVADIY